MVIPMEIWVEYHAAEWMPTGEVLVTMTDNHNVDCGFTQFLVQSPKTQLKRGMVKMVYLATNGAGDVWVAAHDGARILAPLEAVSYEAQVHDDL